MDMFGFIRGSKNCPVKRVVQPQVVRTGMCDLSGRDCDKNNNMNRETDGHAPAVIDAHVESITAAVAASAAVAATHPFLKVLPILVPCCHSLVH